MCQYRVKTYNYISVNTITSLYFDIKNNEIKITKDKSYREEYNIKIIAKH